MAKNRIVYVIWLLAVGGLYVFGNDLGTRVIFYASVIVPITLVFLCAISSRRVQFNLYATDENGIHLQVTGFFVGNIHCVLRCDNLFTEQVREVNMLLPMDNLPLGSKHCGMYRFTIIQPVVMDIFGLAVCKIKSQEQAEMLIMPKRYDIEIKLRPDTDAAGESDEYSQLHPGNDPNDTFGIREYTPGDPLRRIHWKLSNKANKLLVREWGLPVINNILVLIKTAAQDHDHANKMANEAYSVCHALLEANISHTLGWYGANGYKTHDVTSEADVDAAFARLLENPLTIQDDAHTPFGYSQVIVVGVPT